MNYWAAEIVTHADTALSSDHAQVWADFEASSSAVVVGNNDLIYNLPAGYQIAGEGFEHAVGEGETLYYQPALKAVEETYTSLDGTGATVTDWHLHPCVIRLTMDTFEQVDIIDLTPQEPTIDWYRDCLRNAPPPLISEGLSQAGFAAWGMVADAGGKFYSILRVGDWLIPQIGNANQLYAYNLSTETFFRLAGWDETGHPEQMRKADTQSEIDFLAYAHDRSYFNVISRLSGTQVLILRETHTVEAEVVSNFSGAKIEPRTITFESTSADVSDYFKETWVNASGTTSAEVTPPENAGLYKPFEWDEAAFQCGGLVGEPWSGNAIPPLPDHYPERTKAAAAAEMIAAVGDDLAYISALPRFAGVAIADAEITLEIWDFPSTGDPAYVSTVQTWDAGEWSPGNLLRGVTDWEISETTYGALPVVVDTAFASNYVIDPPDVTGYENNGDSDFSRGNGVMLHSYWSSSVPLESYLRWGITSEDRNNCPGPSGPWLDKGEVDTTPGKEVILTILRTPIASTPSLPSPPAFHPCKYVTDGSILIGLPREFGPDMSWIGAVSNATYNAALKARVRVECLGLDVGEPSWTVDVLDYASPHLSGDRYVQDAGAGISNGVLTSQFLYLVVKDLAGARLLKIRVRDLLDESEAVIEPAGTVVSYPLITGTIGQSLTLYRDNLVVVNRRLVGLSNTAYFEITGV